MTHCNTSANQKSILNLEAKPEIQELLAAKNAEMAARMTELDRQSPQQPKIDPLEVARTSSPLLQYLVSTKDLQPVALPDAEVESSGEPTSRIALSVHNRDEWNKNLQQAINQIKALGYEPGDTVPIRLIPGKGVPESLFSDKKMARGRKYDLELIQDGGYKLIWYTWKKTGTNSDGTDKGIYEKDLNRFSRDWWEELILQNSRGYGVYLIPNKGGHFNKDTTHWQSVFYEVDDKSLSQQQALIDDFAAKTGIKPSVVVKTRKSLHVYFRLVKSEWHLSDWADALQKPTILAFQSDPSITNNARLMRLAGFYHTKYDKSDGAFNFVKCELEVCEPEREYTREQYRKALVLYSGGEYSEDKLEILKYVSDAAKAEWFYLEDDYQLMPKVHQVIQCPDELVKELKRRTNAYLAMLRREHNVEVVDPTEAWTKPIEQLDAHRHVDYVFEDDGEKDVFRWAQYLYGYNPEGRPGWITGQDPTIPEDERGDHSLDTLHINKESGKFISHRGTCTKEIYRCLRELAFKANPEEEKLWKAKMSKAKAQSRSRKEEGEISKDEYKQRKLKPATTTEDENELARARQAKFEAEEREFAEYQARLAIDKSRLHKYYQCTERYLSKSTFKKFPTIKQCEVKGQMLGLKAPKGTGKSQRIKQYIKLAHDAKWTTISVTPRVNLGLSQSAEWGIPWISEDGIEVFIGNQGDQKNEMSCCWDSLHKLCRKDYRNKPILLIIDEIESGLEHLATSTTFKGKGTRAAVYSQLNRIVDHITRHGGLIIGADADLSQISLGYIQDIAPRLPVTVIENTYVIPKKEIDVYFNKDGNVKAQILLDIEGNNRFICACDSKDDVKDFYDHAMKNVPLELQHKYWAIHADNVNEPENQARIKDFNGRLLKEQPCGVFFSPTITVGVSIDVEYFSMGYGDFKGSVTADVARQMTARNREIIPWVIFADNLCDRKGDNTPTTPEAVKSDYINQIKDQANLYGWMTEKLLREDQEKFGSGIEELEAQIRLLKTLTQDTRSIETAEFHLLGDVLAKQNFQKKYFHKCFVKGMESEGWKVVSKRGDKTAATEELKEAREERHKKESEEIASADCSHILSPEMARDILTTSSKREERIPAEKVVLADRANLEVQDLDAESVKILKYERGYQEGVRTEWYIRNSEASLRKDARSMAKLVKDVVDFEICSPQDARGKSIWINEVNRLGIFDIIDLDDDERDYKKEDFQPVIDKIKHLKNKQLEKWAAKLGINWDAKKHKRNGILKNPVGRVIKPILEKLGYSFVQAKKNSKGLNSYKIPAEQINDMLRTKVLAGMDKKEIERQAQRELEKTELHTVLLNQEPNSSVKELVCGDLVSA